MTLANQHLWWGRLCRYHLLRTLAPHRGSELSTATVPQNFSRSTSNLASSCHQSTKGGLKLDPAASGAWKPSRSMIKQRVARKWRKLDMIIHDLHLQVANWTKPRPKMGVWITLQVVLCCFANIHKDDCGTPNLCHCPKCSPACKRALLRRAPKRWCKLCLVLLWLQVSSIWWFSWYIWVWDSVKPNDFPQEVEFCERPKT
jgi:hypothetical protein